MPMPTDIGVIDLMLAIPGDDNSQFYEWIKPMLMDRESHEMFKCRGTETASRPILRCL